MEGKTIAIVVGGVVVLFIGYSMIQAQNANAALQQQSIANPQTTSVPWYQSLVSGLTQGAIIGFRTPVAANSNGADRAAWEANQSAKIAANNGHPGTPASSTASSVGDAAARAMA